jgi:U32 family peptidase
MAGINQTRQGKLNIAIPEILAPCGTPEAVTAAVNAGCDAVYLGGDLFSARAFAGNFDTRHMIETIDFCHLFGVKVYMTVNTLLKESEISRLTEYMRPFYEAGLDGVIVQDVGVVRVLKNEFPDMPLHASTQMSISSWYGAKLLKGLGLTRIVPARELTLQEIIEIRKKVDIEIETFVHGAMCYAYSGKCLLSSFLGGRSGNRGRCAQPCRQCYELVQNKSIHEYIMSLKDMCTLKILPELIDAGIASFKIEGRMKNHYYVAATVDAYKTARDFYLEGHTAEQYQALADKLMDNMQDIYNRGGFCTGYYYIEDDKRKGAAAKGLEMAANKRPNHSGLVVGTIDAVKGPDVTIKAEHDIHQQDVLEIVPTGIELTSNKEEKAHHKLILKGKELKKIRPGMKVHRTRNNHLLKKIDERLIKAERQTAAAAVINAQVGEPLSIIIRSLNAESIETATSGYSINNDTNETGIEQPGGRKIPGTAQVTVAGNIINAAENKPTDRQQLISKMLKTGGTNVSLTVECHMDDNAFVPMSEFNALRREAVEEYKRQLACSYHR